ncbi:MAG: DEAD/DEAH box helicase [Syntrophomonadaceae bacterium]|nr:DEAD/DEAH box helicase [Syntrophomonadaceae bacterium]MDH7497787.1 DEAD/DEAH box helicase [Syntrophomonadaceae bacterium]
MEVEALVQQLFPDRAGVHLHAIPARPARYGEPVPPLPPSWQRVMAGRRLYSHQCRVRELVRSARNVIVTTSTASGKTLAFALPVMEALETDAAGTALFLCPTKALANDQLATLRELERLTGHDLGAAVYDGDTPTARRPAIRERSRLVITNPHELHHLLPWHHKWARFLRGLRFVVIDEAHSYRGVFGSHVGLLLRRLRRICRHYGTAPQFILASATLANAAEFAGRLTGLQCVLVDEDGAPRGEKGFVLVNPYARGAARRGLLAETTRIFTHLVAQGLQVLCFVGSRRAAETLAMQARAALEERSPGLGETVAAYRAGYLPHERRELEAGLKRGSLRGVVSTNALELGIDIGSLDAVVQCGYPGTMASTWQQAGRAGRGLAPSVVFMVAGFNQLDQYFVRHPERFFSAPHEHAIVDVANPHVLCPQLMCAAAELPLAEGDREFFGEPLAEAAAVLSASRLLRPTARGLAYAGRGRVTEQVSLDGADPDTFVVRCQDQVLETLSRQQAFREAHPGAILFHRGDSYEVLALDLETGIIEARRCECDYTTEAVKTARIEVGKASRSRRWQDFTAWFGELRIDERYTAYKVVSRESVVAVKPLDLPESTFTSQGLWFCLPAGVVRELQAAGLDLAGGLHAAEHALIAVMPFHVMCDRWDIGGVSTPEHASTGGPSIFIYDGYQGGMGLAQRGFELLPELVRTARQLVEDCTCRGGCPGCVYSPKCGNLNQPMDKQAALLLLRALEQRCAGPAPAAT